MNTHPEGKEGYQTWEATVKCLICSETLTLSAPDKSSELAIGNIVSKARLKHGFGELGGEVCSLGGGQSVEDFEVISFDILH